MAFTDIFDNSIVNLALAKLHLRIDDDDTALDDILQLAIDGAKRKADNYCQDSFDPVPADIEMWILSQIIIFWERKSPLLKSNQQTDIGISQWTFDYDDDYAALKPYRREVGFGPS